MTSASTPSAVESALLAPAARAVEVLGGDLTEKSLRLYLDGLPGVDAVGLEARARPPLERARLRPRLRCGRSTRPSR